MNGLLLMLGFLTHTLNLTNISICYRKHENEKKRAYEQRIREVEHSSFTPLVLSATGGNGEAELCLL